MIDFEKDFRTCATCRCTVPADMRCTCDLARDNHLAAIRARRMICTPEVAAYNSHSEQGLHVEQYWQESDTQDATVPMPSYRIKWGSTLMLCAACLFLAMLFLRATDGLTKWGRQINRGADVNVLKDGTARR